uniref:Uncharacterized protein n=1 Tax=Anguilla anguilla TaxID=7936 RepID=A0A0E9RDZ0_ANGAN
MYICQSLSISLQTKKVQIHFRFFV